MSRVGFFTVGYIFKSDCAAGYEAGRKLAEMGYEVVELSGDVLTMVDELQRRHYDVCIIIGTAKRGRPPGYVESYEFKPRDFRDVLDAGDALRPSLSGRISLEDLLNGLSVFKIDKRVYVVECEPPNTQPGMGLSDRGKECVDKLVEEALRIYRHVST